VSTRVRTGHQTGGVGPPGRVFARVCPRCRAFAALESGKVVARAARGAAEVARLWGHLLRRREVGRPASRGSFARGSVSAPAPWHEIGLVFSRGRCRSLPTWVLSLFGQSPHLGALLAGTGDAYAATAAYALGFLLSRTLSLTAVAGFARRERGGFSALVSPRAPGSLRTRVFGGGPDSRLSFFGGPLLQRWPCLALGPTHCNPPHLAGRFRCAPLRRPPLRFLRRALPGCSALAAGGGGSALPAPRFTAP